MIIVVSGLVAAVVGALGATALVTHRNPVSGPETACTTLDGTTFVALVERSSPYEDRTTLVSAEPTAPKGPAGLLGGAPVTSACRYTVTRAGTRSTSLLYLGRRGGRRVIARGERTGSEPIDAGDAAYYQFDRTRPVGAVRFGDRYAVIVGAGVEPVRNGRATALRPGASIDEATGEVMLMLLRGLAVRFGSTAASGAPAKGRMTSTTIAAAELCPTLSSAVTGWTDGDPRAIDPQGDIPDGWQGPLVASVDSCAGTAGTGGSVLVAAFSYPSVAIAQDATTSAVKAARDRQYFDPQPSFTRQGDTWIRSTPTAATGWLPVGTHLVVVDGPDRALVRQTLDAIAATFGS